MHIIKIYIRDILYILHMWYINICIHVHTFHLKYHPIKTSRLILKVHFTKTLQKKARKPMNYWVEDSENYYLGEIGCNTKNPQSIWSLWQKYPQYVSFAYFFAKRHAPMLQCVAASEFVARLRCVCGVFACLPCIWMFAVCLRGVAKYCSVLQCVAVCSCNAATNCVTVCGVTLCCRVLHWNKYVAECCSQLQCAAVRCKV